MPGGKKDPLRRGRSSKNDNNSSRKSEDIDKPVARDAAMAANVNSNHSAAQTSTKAVTPVKLKSKIKVVNPIDNSKMATASGSKGSKKKKANDPEQSEFDMLLGASETEMHQFTEDGEVIQMEINDGGAAEAEFESGQDTESESEDESDAGGKQSSQDLDYFDNKTSDRGDDTDQASVKTPVKCR